MAQVGSVIPLFVLLQKLLLLSWMDDDLQIMHVRNTFRERNEIEIFRYSMVIVRVKYLLS